mgnify:CR=1 FL=1
MSWILNADSHPLAEMDHNHEIIMKNAEQDPSSEVSRVADGKENKVHLQERTIHSQNSELHNALKTHHFKIMAMINMLYKEIHKT